MDAIYVEGLDGERGQAGQWAKWVEDEGGRLWFRRMKMGALPHLKAFLAKGSKSCARLGVEDKEGVLQCERGGGAQDAVHF